MAYINWDKPFYFDPTTGETTTPDDPGAIAFPTYGNYGGGNYSAGAIGGVAPSDGGQPFTLAELLGNPDPADDPVDPLDYLAYRHDVASAQTGPGYDAAQAQADATLLGAVVQLDASYDPEASLYAGATTFGMIGSLALHGFLGLLSPFKLIAALNDAVHDIEFGLEHLPQSELVQALNFIFEPSGDPNVFVFDFAITTTAFRQELVEGVAMNTLNAILDSGEADDVPLHTGFPFPGTSHYELAYNAMTGDLDLLAA